MRPGGARMVFLDTIVSERRRFFGMEPVCGRRSGVWRVHIVDNPRPSVSRLQEASILLR